MEHITPEEFRKTYFKKNKYKNNPMTYDGSWYQSKKEGRHAQMLDTMKRASNPAQRVVRWEKQVKVPMIVNGKTICNYYCDFHVWFSDGHDEWHEVKGIKSEAYRLKEKLFLALYPDRLFIIF